MALPTLDATFASAADLPRRQMLAKWLVNLQYSGSIEDYWTLPEHYLWAKIAVAAGAPRAEADYISLPKNYVWSDLYNAVSGSSGQTIDRGEKEAIGWIAAAVRGDAGNPQAVATYINWPWRYQVASIITALAVDADAQSFITTSGATDVEGIDQFVKGVKNLGLWDNMVCWPLRSTQNAGTGTTAYSLGGLGTYNGTLVNSPAWDTDGIIKTADNQIINISGTNSALRNALSLFVCFKSTATSQNQRPFCCQGGDGASNYWQLNLNRSTAKEVRALTTRNSNNSVSTIIDITSRESLFNYFGIALNDTSQQFFLNGTSATEETGLAARNPTGTPNADILGTTGATAARGATSFATALTPTLTAEKMSSIYTLYRNTLGLGLSLP